MQHLDDGVLNALLDGELTDAERTDADRHLAQCGACQGRLAEARELMTEADGLVAAMEPPPRPEAGSLPAPGGVRPRRVNYRALAWAASVVLALGAGYLGGASLRVGASVRAEPERALRSAEPSPGPTVLSGEALPVQPTASADTGPPAGGHIIVMPRAAAGSTKPADRQVPTRPAGAAPSPQAALSLRLRTEAPDTSLRGGRAAEVAANVAGIPAGPERPGNGLAERPAAKAANPLALAQIRVAPRVAGTFRRIAWDTAIALLGGSIRLIDGQTPVAVELGTADSAVGLETGQPVVRIRYLTGDRDTVDLLEQRVSAMRQERKTVGDSAVVFQREALPGGGAEIRWEGSGGFLLVLRSALTADRLLQMAARVR